MKLMPIEIDFEIHKAIEAERRGFEEPPFHALRRLLKLDPPTPTANEQVALDGRPWREGLVEIPHGSDARMEYDRGRQIYEGKFLDGKLVAGGKVFSALSDAAKALAVTKKGTKPSLNGWLYWSVRFPGQRKWHRLDDLRRAQRGS